MLACYNILVKFNNFIALNNVSLELKRGYINILLGPNGAGKTTLLKVLASLLKPNSGRVLYGQKDIHELNQEFLYKLGFLSHDIALYNNLTAQENLLFWGKLYKIDQINQRIEEVLNSVKLEEYKNKFVKEYSRGMKQRLAIAKVLIHNPEIILWDEPFTGIDLTTTEVINKILINLKNKGRLILLSTHDLQSGYNLADNIFIINKGNIIYQNSKSLISFSELRNFFN